MDIKQVLKPDKRTEAEKAIDSKIEKLAKDSKSQSDVDNVLNLMKKRKEISSINSRPKLKLDTVVTAGVSLASVILILCAEEFGDQIVRSKSLGFVLRGRV